jgi:hypothetical protein
MEVLVATLMHVSAWARNSSAADHRVSPTASGTQLCQNRSLLLA